MRSLSFAALVVVLAGCETFAGPAPSVQKVTTSFTGPFVRGNFAPQGWIYLDAGPTGLPAAIFLRRDGTWKLGEAGVPGWYAIERATGRIGRDGTLEGFPSDGFSKSALVWSTGVRATIDGRRVRASGPDSKGPSPYRTWEDDPPPRPGPLPLRAEDALCTPVVGSDLRLSFRGTLPVTRSLAGNLALDDRRFLYVWNDRSWSLLEPPPMDEPGLREVASGTVAEDGTVAGLPAGRYAWDSQQGWVDATVGGVPLPRGILRWSGNDLVSPGLRTRGNTRRALAIHYGKGPRKGQTACLIAADGAWTLRGLDAVASGSIAADGSLQGLPPDALLGASRAWEGAPFEPIGPLP